jgi:hypothetical protein
VVRHFRPAYDAMLQRATSHMFPTLDKSHTSTKKLPSMRAELAMHCVVAVARRVFGGQFSFTPLLANHDPPNWQKT